MFFFLIFWCWNQRTIFIFFAPFPQYYFSFSSCVSYPYFLVIVCLTLFLLYFLQYPSLVFCYSYWWYLWTSLLWTNDLKPKLGLCFAIQLSNFLESSQLWHPPFPWIPNFYIDFLTSVFVLAMGLALPILHQLLFIALMHLLMCQPLDRAVVSKARILFMQFELL